MSYANYVSGVQKGTIGQPNAEYSLLVSGNNDYTGGSGIMIKNNITINDGNSHKGTRIYQNADNNTFIDFRSDNDKSLSVRMQDDASPGNFSNMLTLNKDTVTDTSVYGATIGGRVNASQYYVSQADNRAPNLPGVYIGMDSSTIGFLKINKGSGTGGFTFNNYNSDGTIYKNNMNLNASGTVQFPYYRTTTDTQDSESFAIATFDSNGNLTRDYNQNKRIRSIETRMSNVEGNTSTSMTSKMNEVIGRINGLRIWSSNIETVSPSL